MGKLITLALLFLATSLQLSAAKKVEQVVVAYVTSASTGSIDVSVITHINYAFAHVGEDFCSVKIDNPERLKEIAALKEEKKDLKILLSIGGWGSGRFSEMAADEELRTAFAWECKMVVEEYGIDGIDIDWEYPTIGSAGISSSKDDTENFTLLMQDIRKAIGKKRLLTLATVASGKWIDFVAIDPYIDFINMMTYDISRPPKHHSALFDSGISADVTCHSATEAHVTAGAPIEKLVLGVPFYGRGDDQIGNFINYNKLIELDGYQKVWDKEAKVPYLADEKGHLVCSFDDERSIKEKVKYVKKRGLLGIMYWQYGGDDNSGSLREAVYNELFNQN